MAAVMEMVPAVGMYNMNDDIGSKSNFTRYIFIVQYEIRTHQRQLGKLEALKWQLWKMYILAKHKHHTNNNNNNHTNHEQYQHAFYSYFIELAFVCSSALINIIIFMVIFSFFLCSVEITF